MAWSNWAISESVACSSAPTRSPVPPQARRATFRQNYAEMILTMPRVTSGHSVVSPTRWPSWCRLSRPKIWRRCAETSLVSVRLALADLLLLSLLLRFCSLLLPFCSALLFTLFTLSYARSDTGHLTLFSSVNVSRHLA